MKLLLLVFLMNKIVTLRCPASDAFLVPHEWYQTGDFIIGFSFLSIVITKFYQHILALAFAVKEINEDSQILPNITLGLHIYDSYHNSRMTYRTTLDLLFKSQEFIPNYKCDSQKNLMAIIGGLGSDTSSYMQAIIFLHIFPLLLMDNGSLFLFETTKLSLLYCMVPNEDHQYAGVIQLLLHFGWTWIGVFTLDTNKGERFFQKLQSLLSQNGICIAFSQNIPQLVNLENISELLQRNSIICNKLIDQNANAFLVYGESFTILWLRIVVFLCELEDKECTSYKKVWILMDPIDFILTAFQRGFDLQMFHGALFFTVHSREVQGFKEFLQVIKPSTHKNGFFQEMQMTGQSYNIYNAVYAITHSLHEAVSSRFRKREIQRFEFPDLQPWQVMFQKILYLSFVLVNSTTTTNHGCLLWPILTFTRNIEVLPLSRCNDHCFPGYWRKGDEEKKFCCYDCVQCLEGKISNKMGRLDIPRNHYPNKEKIECIVKPVVFLNIEENLGTGLASTALCFFFLTMWVLGTFIKYRDTPIVKANNRSLTYTLLVSLLLCFLSSLFFLSHPGKVTCLLRQSMFGITFSIAISSVLAKTITVVVAFMATKPGSQMRKWVGKRLAFSIVLSCSLLQVCICILWLATSPPFPELDMHSESQEMILQCNEGATFFIYCVLGYMGILAIASFIVAFLARKLPDSFNEAKFITFSMLAFCSVWISFFPAYLSTKGKAMVAVEVFSILSSSAALLGCIFLPKCYIIVFRPQLNHREQLIKRA
uniref:G-protein coupled receptors family 3 profile domain-containing protein n=1 Tax=Naja naja TaxID=35670 RepID=A0A8C6X738_NAJNA